MEAKPAEHMPHTAPVTRDEVEAELISSLYKRTRPLLLANIGAMSLLTMSLWSSANTFYLLSWAIALFSWTMLRFALAKLYLRRPRSVGEAKHWVYAFSVGSGVAGTLWGISILLIGSLGPEHAKLVAAFMMAALSASAIAGYTNSIIAFGAFTAPALTPFGIHMIWFDGEPSWIIASFVVFWGLLLWSMARHLNDGFKENVGLMLGNLRLIDHLSLAKDRAEMANRAKTSFLGNMSHELRTPLNAVIGYSEMMKLQMLGPIGNPQYVEYVEHIHDRGQHLLGFVAQVFELSQLEAGAVELTETRIDVAKLVSEAVEAIIPATSTDRIEFTAMIATNLPTLRGDEGKLQEILRHLLSNAVKFTPAEGAVTVAAERTPDGGLALCIRDTGIGMDPADIDRVTTPFQHLENQDHLKRRAALKNDVGQTNTGLGLPITRLLVELHDGRLGIESTPGAGTQVTVWLPPERLIDVEHDQTVMSTGDRDQAVPGMLGLASRAAE
nr:HAMP domain-containing sensor histidine kinase [uncultured Dongia sp.]